MTGATLPGLSCRELVGLITEFLEGQLGAQDRLRFEAHLGRCDGCRTYLEQLRTTIQLAGTLREEQIDPNARRVLLEAFRDWRPD